MIDFHSHILPGIDDGSGSVKESVRMLEALASQGVDTVVASSHFYATERTLSRFLQRRGEAMEKLSSALKPGMPRILLGAEVLYFPGVSRMEELPQLCIEGTDILLLEMPFTAWTEAMTREVHDLAYQGRVQVMLAHIERYYADQPVDVWDAFLDEGILMQSNADFFVRWKTRRKALRLLREGRIHLLGTDCHNMEERAPHMDGAMRQIRRHLGEEALEEIDDLGHSLLGAVLKDPH